MTDTPIQIDKGADGILSCRFSEDGSCMVQVKPDHTLAQTLRQAMYEQRAIEISTTGITQRCLVLACQMSGIGSLVDLQFQIQALK